MAQEQSLLQRSLANKGDMTMKEYTKKANELLSRAIETAQRPPIREIPASAEDPNAVLVPHQADGTYQFPWVPQIQSTATRRRRFRIKTSQTRSSSMVAEPEVLQTGVHEESETKDVTISSRQSRGLDDSQASSFPSQASDDGRTEQSSSPFPCEQSADEPMETSQQPEG